MSIHKTLQKVVEELKKGVHPGDLVELIDDLSDEQKKELIDLLSDEDAASIIEEMEEYDQVTLFRLLSKKRASAILREMASDEAVDLLAELSPEEAAELLRLAEEEAEEYTGLLKYPEESAGGIMTTEFISLPADLPAEEAIQRLREIAPEAETIYYVYVVDENSRLIGVLSLRDLIAAADGILLRSIMRRNVISVNASLDQEEVARIVSRYGLLAVPVVDDTGRLLGIVTVDDVLDVLEAEATEDIYKLAGASEIQGVDLVEAPPLKIVRQRLPWLIICLVGGLISGSVIGAFRVTLESIIALAMFIPVIMDMGGNVGTQTSTIFVRGIATGEIGPREVWRFFFREIRVGLFLGVACGILIAVAARFWLGSAALGLVVGISMLMTVVVAALIGTLVPIAFHKAGIDPAIAAGPFVTTIKDVTGLLIYFWTAILFMQYLPLT